MKGWLKMTAAVFNLTFLDEVLFSVLQQKDHSFTFYRNNVASMKLKCDLCLKSDHAECFLACVYSTKSPSYEVLLCWITRLFKCLVCLLKSVTVMLLTRFIWNERVLFIVQGGNLFQVFFSLHHFPFALTTGDNFFQINDCFLFLFFFGSV